MGWNDPVVKIEIKCPKCGGTEFSWRVDKTVRCKSHTCGEKIWTDAFDEVYAAGRDAGVNEAQAAMRSAIGAPGYGADFGRSSSNGHCCDSRHSGLA